MAERLEKRRKTRFLYDNGTLIGEEEEVYEPIVVEAAPEFVGVVATQSLPHGQLPDAAGNWSIYKVYEKNCIWLLHKVKEGSA